MDTSAGGLWRQTGLMFTVKHVHASPPLNPAAFGANSLAEKKCVVQKFTEHPV